MRLTELHPRREEEHAQGGGRAAQEGAQTAAEGAAAGGTGVGAQVVGSGGSFTNLGRMAAARRGLSVTAVHGTHVTTAEVEHLLEWLGSMTPEQRRQVPGLNPQRADIILAGLAVTAELLEQ